MIGSPFLHDTHNPSVRACRPCQLPLHRGAKPFGGRKHPSEGAKPFGGRKHPSEGAKPCEGRRASAPRPVGNHSIEKSLRFRRLFFFPFYFSGCFGWVLAKSFASHCSTRSRGKCWLMSRAAITPTPVSKMRLTA